MTVYADDVDAQHNRTIVYSLKETPMFGPHKIFSIDSNTGLISTIHAEALDREKKAFYTDVIVQARDKGTPTSKSGMSNCTFMHLDAKSRCLRLFAAA